MSEISRAALFGKLNSLGYKAIEAATVFCKLRGNPHVEMAHWLFQILQSQDSDFHRIVRHYEVDPARLAADLTRSLDSLPRGATSISDFSPHIDDAVERGWVYGTLLFKEGAVRTGHLLVGMLKTTGLRNMLYAISPEFKKLKSEALAEDFARITSKSPEENLAARDGSQVGGGAAPGEASGAMAPAQMGKQEALKKFAVDLTARAREGKIDPVLGRDEEIRQIVDILMRRRQNNPILTGEAGVGKTAVVEGFAARIVKGDVPPQLKEVSLLSLDIGLLQAGASMKGEFENRLRQVIEEVQSSPKPIILFIDEAHTIIGAGGPQGGGDAANLLKPELARGELRTVAATTWTEYKKYFEKDPALSRRFQLVKVEEPSEDVCCVMLRGVVPALELHHNVRILDDGLDAAVRLSHRYLPDRQLPDKAVSVLDTACARLALGQAATPASVEDAQRTLDDLAVQERVLRREESVGSDHAERLANIAELRTETEARLGALKTRWEQERDIVTKVRERREKLEKDPALSRRFQLVKVEEPSEDVCCVMLRGVVPALELHHNVR
ncbi:MAG: AAA family ATPase, partial [Burkholderiales bacterium]